MKKEVLKQMHKINSVFDLIIFAYSQIAGIHEDQYYCEYLNLQKTCHDTIWKDVNLQFEELLNDNISVDAFCKEMKKIQSPYLFSLYVHLLVMFDNVLDNREQYSIFRKKFSLKNRIVEKTGPIEASFSQYKFYYLFHKEAYIRNNIIENLGIRTRKIRSGIWEYIENYIIIPGSGRYQINLFEYLKNSMENVAEKGCMKIGIVPNGRKSWFEEKNEKDSFGIVIEENENNIQFYNQVYIKTIKKADDEGVNIIVFPELAINSKTIDILKKYLVVNTLTGQIKNLKFIFMGSLWKNHQNICYIMSSDGTVLLHNEKKKAYVDKNGKMEDLNVISNEINLIDIKGLGRVWYCICKDAIEHRNVTEIYHDFGVNLSVISAFSRSIDPFISEANMIAGEYCGSCIVSNACQARKQDMTGFLSLPGVSVKDSNSRCKIYDYGCPRLLQEDCPGNCMYIYNFCFNEIEKKDEIKYIKVEKNCVDIT